MNLLSAFGKHGKLLSIAVLILLEDIRTCSELEQDEEGRIINTKRVRLPFEYLTPQQEEIISEISIKDEFFVDTNGSKLEVLFEDGSKLVLEMSTYVKKGEQPDIPEELQQLFKEFQETLGCTLERRP